VIVLIVDLEIEGGFVAEEEPVNAVLSLITLVTLVIVIVPVVPDVFVEKCNLVRSTRARDQEE